MKWHSDEWILTWIYFQKYGQQKSGELYLRCLESFRKIQGRGLSNAKHTFSLKLMNFDAYNKGDYSNDGGLNSSKDFKNIIIDKDFSELEKRFFELTSLDFNNTIMEVNDLSCQPLADISYNSITLNNYLSDIKARRYKIPLFQRGFVWSKNQIINFLNAINKGFPFGNIVVWESKTDVNLDERNEYIQKYCENATASDLNNWVLDGQQRTTSIVKQLIDSKDIIYSLTDMKFMKKSKYIDGRFIYSSDLFDSGVNATSITKQYNITLEEATKIIEKIRDRILDTKIGITKINNAELDTAIDIFVEMNTSGKKLSIFDIVHSKWLSQEIDYNLEDFIDNWRKKCKLEISKIDNITIVQALYLTFDKNNISSKNILDYKIEQDCVNYVKNEFENTLNLAHDFLLYKMKFKPELIPSKNLFKFIVYIYAKNKNKELNYNQIKILKNYVKDICLQNFYSSSTNQGLQKNIEHMDNILNGITIAGINKKIIDKDEILEIEYNEDSTKYFYILNLLFLNAKSLTNNQEIEISCLHGKNKEINIHHIIPKEALIDNKKVINIKGSNSLANLAPILKTENLKISNKYPCDYYEEFKMNNEKLDDTLGDLYINPKLLSTINSSCTEEDLMQFWDKRAETIVEAIKNDNI